MNYCHADYTKENSRHYPKNDEPDEDNAKIIFILIIKLMILGMMLLK